MASVLSITGRTKRPAKVDTTCEGGAAIAVSKALAQKRALQGGEGGRKRRVGVGAWAATSEPVGLFSLVLMMGARIVAVSTSHSIPVGAEEDE